MTFEELDHWPFLAQLCDMFQSLTGLPFDLLDVQQRLSPCLAAMQKPHVFCRQVQCSASGRQQCRLSAQNAGIESATAVTPFVYRCHAGLVDITVPIISRGTLIGYLCSGRLRTGTPTARELARLTAAWRAAGYDAARLKRAYLATQVVEPAKMDAIVRFLMFIVRYMLDMEDQISALSKQVGARDPVVKAQALFKTHYADKLTLESMARYAGLSPSRFNHVFKARTGTGCMHYLQQVRIARAKELLATSSLRVTEIALAVGFGSLGSFNRSFKAIEGVSPRIFRKRSTLP